jgi:hypothetical protein
MSGQRKALIIANDTYEQEALRNLLAPAADAEALGRVLSDPQIGDFTVQVVRNEPSHVLEAQIEDLFSESRPDDVLLMHYSGHGLKSESQELFFAASNTRPNRLRATAVSADFVQQCMRDSRSRSIVLLLDCCYAGAFPQGVKVRAAGDVHVLDSFSQEKSGGRGRAVITASNAMEYAFEGDQLADDQHRRPSVFTAALVEGLATGDADRDEDGWVSLDELYDYVLNKVRDQNPHQTPSRQVDLEGDLYLAHSRRRRIRPAPIPADLQAAIASPDMYARLGAVGELRSRLASDDLPVAAGAYKALAELARNDIRYVAEPAAAALSEAALQPAQRELHFGQAEQGSAPPHKILQLLGPPIARTCVPRSSDAWIRVDQVAEGLDISIDTTGTGSLQGSLDLKGPTGEAVIAIAIDLIPPPPQGPPPRGPSAPTYQGIMAPATRADKPERAPSSLLPSASASPLSASAVPTNTPPHDTNVQASPARHMSPASSEPPELQPGQQDADHRPEAVGRPTEEQARRGAQETAERAAEVTPSTAHLTSSGAAGLLAAGFGILLIGLCVDAVVILLDTSAHGPGWAIVAANALGIAVTLSGVRQNPILASILLWNLAWGIVYWFSILVPHYTSYSTVSTVLVTECVIAAVGNGGLCIWILALRAKGRDVDPFLAIFAGLSSVAYALAAIAWAALPSPDRPVWNALASVIIVTVVVGLLAMLRALRPGTTGSQKQLSGHTEQTAPQI